MKALGGGTVPSGVAGVCLSRAAYAQNAAAITSTCGSGAGRQRWRLAGRAIRDGSYCLAVASPGKTATLEMAWNFLVPEHGADRMGRDKSLYEIAQWYPRAAVYDDLRGWNNDPYIGQGEFYLDYGDYTVAVTVPAGYIVAGTGVLENSKDVLTQTQLAQVLQVSQGAVSKVEPRADMYISTLRSYVRAIGGDLQIRAVFPEGEVLIDQFEDLNPNSTRRSARDLRADDGGRA